MLEAIQKEIIDLAVVLITTFAGFVTKEAVAFLKKKGIVHQLENNKAIVKIVVNAIEQTYKELHGEEKLNLAKMELLELMQQGKIKMSEKELDLMIESIVKEMNSKAREELSKK